MNWQRLLMQGVLIFLTGLTFAFASIIKSDVIIMSARFFSWLPVCGMVILTLGLLECLDALFSKDLRDFIQQIDVGVLDSVVGALLLFGISDTPERLSLLIAVYLLVRSIIRIVMAYTLRMPNTLLIVGSSLLTIILGLLVWYGWPSFDGWFLALCLSIEISLRGVTTIFFAFWVRDQNSDAVYTQFV
jgi:uncharacterized membrane protein HdeD (DUF308 family)